MTTPSESAPVNPPPGDESSLGSGLHTIWLIISIAVAMAVLLILYFEPYRTADTSEGQARPEESALITDSGTLHIKSESPLKTKVAFDKVQLTEVKTPLLVVTGSVAARLGSGRDSASTRWDFVTTDLANAYVDWLKARDEVAFTEKQYESIKELSETRKDAQTKAVERLTMLVEIGTDSKKDLAAAKAELAQIAIQGQKDVHEAETAKKNAARNRGTLERLLFQAGADPELLVKAKDNLALVVAEVPEVKTSLVSVGQECEATFYAFPQEPARGRVGSVAPTLSRDRRTLRVFFELPDPKSRLKPGMFADVGLGAEPRKIKLIPAAAVLHVGKFDYVFAQVEGSVNDWDAVKVMLGDVHKDCIEVRAGLDAERVVIGQGAILLRPYLGAILQKRGVR